MVPVISGKFGEIWLGLITHFATVLQFLFASIQSGVEENAMNHGKANKMSPALAGDVLGAHASATSQGAEAAPTSCSSGTSVHAERPWGDLFEYPFVSDKQQ